MTSKGQFTIPQRFRELLRLSAGSKLVMVTDGEHLLLKPITTPEGKVFRRVIQHMREIASKANGGTGSVTKYDKTRPRKLATRV